MIGTVVNVGTILLGSAIGLLAKKGIPKRYEQIIMSGASLTVGLIGLQMALKTQNVVILLISLIVGGMIGEWLNIDQGINHFGDWINRRMGKSQDNIGQGFVTASLVFCVGAMAIVGSIQDGLKGDASILYVKALLDGIISIVFASSMGIGVALSSISILLYQGSITILASLIGGLVTDGIINEISAVGGVLIVSLSLLMLDIKQIKVANLLPAIPIVAILASVV